MKNFKKDANNLLTHTKDAKGITLLALVVTIIILIILATVSVNILVMDNGLIQKATGTGELAKDVTEDEHVKLAVADALITGAGKLSTDNVKNALKSEFGEEKVTDATFSGEGPWTFKGERKSYEIGSTGKVQETKEPMHAKDVLVTNSNGLEDYQKSPFVQYNDKMCRVLYNDEEHGLQIVTENCLETVALGYNDSISSKQDPTVSSSDFDVGPYNDFKCAAASYNSAIHTLNSKAKNYMDADGIAVDARCLGYESKLENEKFKEENEENFYSIDNDFFSNYNGKLKSGDSYYEEDVNQLKILVLNADKHEWLASRKISYSDGSGVYSIIRSLYTNGTVDAGHYILLILEKNSDWSSYTGYSYGFRPVFLLNGDTVVLSGNGTRETPFILGL